MESDRMGCLLPALTEAKFANQRDVVLNERRQNYENRPYGLASMAMLAALFPPDHPYHWTTIGEIADLRAVRLDECARSSARYYHPANASLALAGDIDPDAALALVRALLRRAFRAGPRASSRCAADAALDGERGSCSRIASSCRASTSRGCRRRCSPRRRGARSGRGSAGQRQDVAPVSSGSCSTSASRPTCRRRRIRARSAASSRSPRPRRPGHTLAELEASMLERSRGSATDGPTDDEIERGRVQAEAQFVFRLQTVGGFGGKSDQLNAYNVFRGDPGVLRPRSRALPRGHDRRRCGSAVARYLDPAPARDAQRRAARPRRARGSRFHAGGRVVTTLDHASIARGCRSPGPARRSLSRHRASTLPNGLRVWTRAARGGAGRRVDRCSIRRGASTIRRARKGSRRDGRHARRGQRRPVGDRDARSARAPRRAARHRHRRPTRRCSASRR